MSTNRNSLPYFAVAFVRLLFPAEAKLAMEVADHPTTGYTGLPSKGSSGNLREVDLRETPSVQSKTLQEKVQALIKTGTVILPLTCISNSTLKLCLI